MPLAVQVPPPEVVAQVQVVLAALSWAGRVSVTVAPVTAVGPLFEATMVYTTPVSPHVSAEAAFVFVIARSA